MTLVKICGITNLLDAVAAIDAGADALGFNFYKPSARYIEPSKAREIIDKLPQALLKVGVFVNEVTPAVVQEIAIEAGVNALQLHGDESPEYCTSLSNWYVIKAISVDEHFDPLQVRSYPVTAVMLDAKHPKLRGGTGQVIDWSIARQVSDQGVRLFLAGGLSAENVDEAIKTANPYAVDACSSLENMPGKKDPTRMTAFVNSVRGSSETIT